MKKPTRVEGYNEAIRDVIIHVEDMKEIIKEVDTIDDDSIVKKTIIETLTQVQERVRILLKYINND